MIAIPTLSGKEIAPSEKLPIRSLGDLLAVLHTICTDGMLPMLRSTAVKLEEFFQKPSSEITIDTLDRYREDFSEYLTMRKYERNSVRSYSNYLRVLVQKAKELGCYTTVRPISPEWESLLPEARRLNCNTILLHFARSETSPGEVTEDNLSAWIKKRVERGFGYHTAYSKASRLRRILDAAGYVMHLDQSKIQKGRYGLSVSEFPDKMRSEVEMLLRWKQAEFAPGRPKGGKQRPITAKGFRQTLAQLVGFVYNIDAIAKPQSLMELLTEELLTRYIEWALTVRNNNARSLKKGLGTLHGTVRHHPAYKQQDWEWFSSLIASIPLEAEGAVQERKNLKYLPYETVAAISAKIREGRAAAAKVSLKELAIQVRNELMLEWLVTLVWRQRNIRECRIGGAKPNLFKAKVPKNSSVSKQPWVLSAERDDSEATFWQFKFSSTETKSGRPVHCVLPKKLVNLLEEYLRYHRNQFILGQDPGTLFLDTEGQPLTTAQVNIIVSEQTLRYGGRVVTPHLFRDILAFAWLEKKPEDYLTVSKLLWHKNINVTINTYGNRFNESTALCRLEEVFG